MIALKLALQSLAGLAAAGSVFAGGYKLINADSSGFEYLLVNSGTLPTNDFENGLLFTGNNKNYQCKNVEKGIDVSCEVFNTSSDTGPAYLDLEKILSKELLFKTGISTSTTYVLKVKKSFSELTTISLVTKDSTKTFANLTIKYKLGSDLKNLKTNLVIVRSTNLASNASSLTTATGKFKCDIENGTQNIECDVYKTSTAKTTNDFVVNDFTTLTKVISASDLTNNNFFVVDLKTNKFTKEQFKNKKIFLSHLSTAPSSTATKISDLIFDQAVLGDLTHTTNKFGYPISKT